MTLWNHGRVPSSPISPRLSIQVVELVERLRAQHVFPLSMLQLHEDEWHQMVGDVAEQAESEQPFSMDADQ